MEIFVLSSMFRPGKLSTKPKLKISVERDLITKEKRFHESTHLLYS